MKIEEYLKTVEIIQIPEYWLPVEKTTAENLRDRLCPRAKIREGSHPHTPSGTVLHVSGATGTGFVRSSLSGIPPDTDHYALFLLDQENNGWLVSSSPEYLFAGCSCLGDKSADLEISSLPWIWRPSFIREKSTFDLFLTQYARGIRNFDREAYIRELARLGFTHVEVNALATQFSWEQGVEGEFYPDFYTYCPALDQFVSSRLNEGIYPQEYLDANLSRLVDNARMAVKYGLVPGLLCFEPRSVPDVFFQKYPTLRGPRVDHPFRSFKPRYAMSLVHPAVRAHYREMLSKLMRIVPELGFMTIWSNDSGAGFEHTKSLYVGRNGGAYMIREWKDDKEIARTAAAHIASFFHLLKDEALSVNPEFRVITRLESFYGEREYLWPVLKNGVDVEANSLLTQGWESCYPHPSYPDVKVLGSIYHTGFYQEEKELLDELRERGSEAYFFHFFGVHGAHEPLLGIPFPWLTYEKLHSARAKTVTHLSHVGGIQPPDMVPFAVNQEIFRLYQFDPEMDIDTSVASIASAYAGPEHSGDLVSGWRLIDEAVRKAIPLPIYSHYGVVWQRLFVRPLVPDIGKIPEEYRAYYEKYMCTSVHNPNRVDLSKDVLFDLISPDYAWSVMEKMDEQALPALDKAVRLFSGRIEPGRKDVFADQLVRARALKCLFMMLRNTACWIYSVHTFLRTEESDLRNRCLSLLDDLMDREIENTEELIELWENTDVEWMIVGEVETPFIHGENFGALLRKKVDLIKSYRSHKPFIDPDYMFRFKGKKKKKKTSAGHDVGRSGADGRD